MKIASLFLVSFLAACGSDATTVGTVTAGGEAFDIKREGDAPAAGSSTTMVIKPEGAKPDSVDGWIGLETDDDLAVDGVYDSGDGDYDMDMTVQSPLPAGSKFFYEITIAGQVSTGSIDLK